LNKGPSEREKKKKKKERKKELHEERTCARKRKNRLIFKA